MRIAIMQPYLFPYIGYFQLIRAVEKFIVYDDVTYIKGGWINRNNILLNGAPYLFTVPLVNASSNTPICETQVNYKLPWRPKLLKTLQQAYKKAPQYDSVYPLIEGILDAEAASISGLAFQGMKLICAYLGMDTEIQETSAGYDNKHLAAQDRVLDICRIEGADHYVNPIGGMELYSKEDFRERGIRLDFIKTHKVEYPQLRQPFTPWLSIIDVLMFNSPEETLALLDQYELI